MTVVTLATGLIAFQTHRTPTIPEAAPTAAAQLADSASEPSSPPYADWDEAVGHLSDSSTPFTFTVLGDSTSNDRNEWVFLTAAWISDEFNRPVEIHQWDSTTNQYNETRSIGEGTGEPVIIWNSSAPGRAASYSIEHFKTATPERPDAVIINHGHNGGTGARRQISQLANMVKGPWDKPPALAVILQNPHTAKETAKQRATLSGLLESRYSDGSVKIIDVRKAFEDNGNVADLLMDDGLHPNH